MNQHNNSVVFHINENNKWETVLKNIKNLLQETNELNIEVLANGEAVAYYQTTDPWNIYHSQMKQLNIHFIACNNSLKSMNLTKEQIFDFVEIVPNGVYALVIKQQEGFAYIKP